MDTTKRQRLEAAGLQVGSVADFLGLTTEENELVETKVALIDGLKPQSGAEPAEVIASISGSPADAATAV